jgi:hypothetical protein
MTREEGQLAEIVARIIDIRRAQVRINPTWIATEALKEIDPANRSIALVRTGCHLQLRQIAREQCRTLFEDSEDDDEPRFAVIEGLQWRYPTKRSKEDHEGRAKLAHANTLAAWDRARRAA